MSSDLRSTSLEPDPAFPYGPLQPGSPATFLGILLQMLIDGRSAEPEELGLSWLPLEEGAMEGGLNMFRSEFGMDKGASADQLLSKGRELFRTLREKESESAEETEDTDEEEERERPQSIGPDGVASHLRWIAASGAVGLLRATWISLLAWSEIRWTPPGLRRRRVLVIGSGRTVNSGWDPGRRDDHSGPSTMLERQRSLRPLEMDRMRVLFTELRRLAAAGLLESVILSNGAVLNCRDICHLFHRI